MVSTEGESGAGGAAGPPIRVLKEDSRARVEALLDRTPPLCRKTYRTPSHLRWRTILRRSKAQREFENLTRLCAAGLPAVAPVEWGETRDALGCVVESHLITQLIDAPSMKTLLRSDRPCPRQRHALAVSFGHLMRAIHEAGLLSMTLLPRNVLVDADGSLHVCDQPALLGFRRSIVGSWRASVDVYDAAFSPARRGDFTRTDRYRLVLAYTAGDRRHCRHLWRSLANRKRRTNRAIRGLIGALGQLRALFVRGRAGPDGGGQARELRLGPRR